MKRHPHLGTGLTAGAFFLIGTLAVAQTAPASRTTRPRDAASGQAAGMAVDHAGGNGVRRADTGKSGENAAQRRSGSITILADHGEDATQRKDGEVQSADFPRSSNARNSAHATESMKVIYEDTGKSGDNPMYEGKGEANVNPGAGSSSDKSMGSAHATESIQRKHIAGVKYENRMANPSQDAQSNPSGNAQPNKMATKENGVPASKP